MYRPLPPEVTIKQSEIEGLGLFATRDLEIGVKLGISHRVLRDGELVRTPLGGFYNHSNNPNIEKRRIELSNGEAIFYLHVVREVGKGEELTCKYTFYIP